MNNQLIHVGIVGGAGYAAGQLLAFLQHHPHVHVKFVQSTSQSTKLVRDIHPFVLGDDWVFVSKADADVDVLFLCMGHGRSATFLQDYVVQNDQIIIDLSRDFRLDGSHSFVYGLPEINREVIQKAKRIANPGCFATAIQLALLPMAHQQLLIKDIHVHAITGSTGAGQSLTRTSHFTWRNQNVSLYKVLNHQHVPEVINGLKVLQPTNLGPIHFVPMRGNYTKGILASVYFKTDWTEEKVVKCYKEYYLNHPFVSIRSEPIDLKQVVGTNHTFLHIQKVGQMIHITSVLDNLIKGAAGQAIQNMNLSCGLVETAGLMVPGMNY